MKHILFISLLLVTSSSYSLQTKANLQGFWLVCDTETLCEEDEKSIYMVFTDTTVNYLFNMGGELQSITTPMKYVYTKDKLLVSDDRRTEEWGVLLINDDCIALKFKDQENKYLFRLKE